MTVEQLNSLDRAEFVAEIGWIFEASPWVAERAWHRRPFADRDALHAAMVEELMQARPAEQLALLCAHPDLGARAKMSSASVAEQAGAGLDQLSESEYHQLLGWNAEYRGKHGFPFLCAVKGSTKYDILKALSARLDVPREREFTEALRQVCRIARFRLDDALASPRA
jgi:2-oxo-4-hydroxy-4-carboxy-5-ureidoimidazoline decarboxylase